MAAATEVFEILPDGSGQFVEIRPSLLSFEPPQRVVVKTVDAKTVAAIREVLLRTLAPSVPPTLNSEPTDKKE